MSYSSIIEEIITSGSNGYEVSTAVSGRHNMLSIQRAGTPQALYFTQLHLYLGNSRTLLSIAQISSHRSLLNFKVQWPFSAALQRRQPMRTPLAIP